MFRDDFSSLCCGFLERGGLNYAEVNSCAMPDLPWLKMAELR